MNNLYDEAAQWITENFPPPSVSDTEIRNFQLWALRKGLLLKDLIVRLYLILKALERMDNEKEALPVHKRLTFAEAFKSEFQNREGFEKDLLVPPGPDFVKDLRRIASWDYSIIGERQQDDQVRDAVTVFQAYTHVFPMLGSVAPSLILALSHAELQFAALTTDVETKILAQEARGKGSSDTINILVARAKHEKGEPDRNETIKVYEALSPRAKKEFLTNQSGFYKKFRIKAEHLSKERLVSWQKAGKDGKPAPPSKPKVVAIIKEYLKAASDTPRVT